MADRIRVFGYWLSMRFTSDLPTLDRIHLVARDDARNIRRDYLIERSPDLFGFTIVECNWGRIGTCGQRRRAAFERPDDAQAHVNRLLSRRKTAHRRIGVAYMLI
jgi:predicted DNA-binding WGR domain protein